MNSGDYIKIIFSAIASWLIPIIAGRIILGFNVTKDFLARYPDVRVIGLSCFFSVLSASTVVFFFVTFYIGMTVHSNYVTLQVGKASFSFPEDGNYNISRNGIGCYALNDQTSKAKNCPPEIGTDTH